tara:strand:- start:135 stop:551 length:417 start_codon:yes stop_codon:yes gene_type:complete
MRQKLLLLFIPILCFFSCDEKLINDIYAEIDVVSDVESTLRYEPNGYSAETNGGSIFYLTGDNTSASLVTNNYEALPTEGFNYRLYVYDWELVGVGCLDIEIRLYKNGYLQKTENIQLGFIAPGDFCSTHGNEFHGEL